MRFVRFNLIAASPRRAALTRVGQGPLEENIS